MSIREKQILNAYAGTGNYRDIFTVSNISSAATKSALPYPDLNLRVKKRTFEIGGVEYEFVTNISTISSVHA